MCIIQGFNDILIYQKLKCRDLCEGPIPLPAKDYRMLMSLSVKRGNSETLNLN